MLFLQDGKLYVRAGEGFVGVNIHPGDIQRVAGTNTNVGNYKQLTEVEALCKFNVSADTPYLFPVNFVETVKQVNVQKPIKHEPEPTDSLIDDFEKPELTEKVEETHATPKAKKTTRKPKK